MRLGKFVLAGPPRRIDFMESETFYLFLDGACTDVVEGNQWCGTTIGVSALGNCSHQNG